MHDLLNKNVAYHKFASSQKTSDKKRATPKKCKRLKRPPMKKGAPLKNARGSKDL
jgi:hypothetical protein